ncbi:MAG TPA: gamma-glutamyl-gamma-aminobutyrate hydrolase family protein [Bryobacteraceae bacterium]|nr:gamma-glutamyl-gamma-aminobutyrate hydrolase family protein [Bryobacteraceae bacterium]
MTSKRVAVFTGGRPDKSAPYLAACRGVGLEPIENPDSLDGCEGVVLTGGSDVNPLRYQQAPHAETDTPDDTRDEREIAAVLAAVQNRMPLLAICRGLQLMNVALGGTLHQHIEGHDHKGVPDVHSARIEPSSRLADIVCAAEYSVNSRHHQAAERIGRGLVVTARGNDGIVEAVEIPASAFALGVQWHPEDRFETHTGDRRLFEAFARAVAENRR